jgi:hypothetical protein
MVDLVKGKTTVVICMLTLGVAKRESYEKIFAIGKLITG